MPFCCLASEFLRRSFRWPRSDVVTGGAFAAFDVAFARALGATVTPPWERLFAAVSWLGEWEVVAAAVLAVAVHLFVSDKPVLATGWLAAQAAGGALNLALKATFERTRPESADAGRVNRLELARAVVDAP
jgi:hypothetical protein